MSTRRVQRTKLDGPLPPPPEPTSVPYSDDWWEEVLAGHSLEVFEVEVTNGDRRTGNRYWLLKAGLTPVQEAQWQDIRCSH
ncbi:MAG: hypothetical protein R3E97_16865 [Candidatus Eisenbacteria bacterium]